MEGAEELAGRMIDCFLCGEPVQITVNKKQRPQISCSCGCMIFINRESAYEFLLLALAQQDSEPPPPDSASGWTASP